LKNNVKSYLHQEMYKKIVSFTDDEDENRLSNLREQVSSNIYEIYSLQLEIVKYLKKRPLYSVEDIFENIDDLERFVWHTIINYNNDKEEFALESEKKYSNELSVMLESEMTTRIKRQIYINKISTNCKI
ncbi:MAG TPA: hypothetical protein PKW61_01930, partial [Tenuifilaceae bacterium]|nr:hypothetical protein [Tenuifilaceae bacterium]